MTRTSQVVPLVYVLALSLGAPSRAAAQAAPPATPPTSSPPAAPADTTPHPTPPSGPPAQPATGAPVVGGGRAGIRREPVPRDPVPRLRSLDTCGEERVRLGVLGAVSGLLGGALAAVFASGPSFVERHPILVFTAGGAGLGVLAASGSPACSG